MKTLRKFGLRSLIVVVVLAPYIVGGVYLLFRAAEKPVYNIGSGTSGGLYTQLADQLAETLNAGYDGNATFHNRQTEGSVENLTLIDRGDLKLAFAQDGLTSGTHVSALALLYTSPLHVIVRSDLDPSEQPSFSDIKKHITSKLRVYIGKDGSGTKPVAEQVFKQYGIALSEVNIVGSDWSFEVAGKQLQSGQADMGFFLIGYGQSAIGSLANGGTTKLVSIDRAEGITTAFPSLIKAKIPAGAYAAKEPFPKKDVETIASKELLVCRSDLDERTAYKIVETIFNSSNKIVRNFTLLTQLSRIDSEHNFYYPIHPGAALFYRHETLPPPFTAAMVTAAIGYSITMGTWIRLAIRRRRIRNLFMKYKSIRERLQHGQCPSEQCPEIITEVIKMQDEGLRLLGSGKIRADEFALIKEYARWSREILEDAGKRDEAKRSLTPIRPVLAELTSMGLQEKAADRPSDGKEKKVKLPVH